MLFEEPKVRKSVQQIVCKLNGDLCYRDDLMQEALIHLWVIETERPGQTLSWYLQSCQFHIINRINSGRSIDSQKRSSQIETWRDDDAVEPLDGAVGDENSVVAQVSVREIIRLLTDWLGERERKTLLFLFDGLGPREIARKTGISHPAVIKHRRKIAAVAISLGINVSMLQ